jgi:hypothetical protein
MMPFRFGSYLAYFKVLLMLNNSQDLNVIEGKLNKPKQTPKTECHIGPKNSPCSGLSLKFLHAAFLTNTSLSLSCAVIGWMGIFLWDKWWCSG